MRTINIVRSVVMGAMFAATSGWAQQTGATSVTMVPGLDLQTNGSMSVGKAKDDLLAGTEKFAQGASRVTEINLDPATMGMVGDHHGPDGNLEKKMKLMVVHTYQYDKPGMFRMEDVEAYAKKLQDGSWSCPVISRDKERLSYICAKTDNDHETNEMVILTAQPQQLTFIHMAGTMSLNDLSRMQDASRGLKVRGGPEPSAKGTMPAPPAPPATPAPAAAPKP